MTYIRTSSRPNQRRSRLIAIFVSGLIVLLAVLQFFMPHFLPALFTTIARPFWRMEFSFESGSLQSPQALLAQNEALKARIQEIESQDQSSDALRTRYSDLLTALGRPELALTSLNAAPSIVVSTSSATSTALSHGGIDSFMTALSSTSGRTLAAILARPPFAPYDELVIDVGADQGIVAGSKVYAPGNVLIGTTSDVLSQTSKVTLFSSPGQSYPVLIGPNHVPAVAIGRGGGQYEAQVPQATSIAEGDIVSDATLEDGTFGTVVSIVNNPANPFITVLFAPSVNIYELRWVFIKK